MASMVISALGKFCLMVWTAGVVITASPIQLVERIKIFLGFISLNVDGTAKTGLN
jgi:hypothetical protein